MPFTKRADIPEFAGEPSELCAVDRIVTAQMNGGSHEPNYLSGWSDCRRCCRAVLLRTPVGWAIFQHQAETCGAPVDNVRARPACLIATDLQKANQSPDAQALSIVLASEAKQSRLSPDAIVRIASSRCSGASAKAASWATPTRSNRSLPVVPGQAKRDPGPIPTASCFAKAGANSTTITLACGYGSSPSRGRQRVLGDHRAKTHATCES